uniref:Putative ovule protein n=1 Tax=Solanum chacoense TaxID=4108 RepID=A0A0V0GM38_SOLCH
MEEINRKKKLGFPFISSNTDEETGKGNQNQALHFTNHSKGNKIHKAKKNEKFALLKDQDFTSK